MAKIRLTKGKFAIVDDADLGLLGQWKWHSVAQYAARREYVPGGKGKSTYILMHRFINNTPEGMDTDHINHDGLDNRRSNLRTVTHQQNAFNPRLNARSTSGHKGVSWVKRIKRWRAHITIDNKYIHLGYFSNIEDAVVARRGAELF